MKKFSGKMTGFEPTKFKFWAMSEWNLRQGFHHQFSADPFVTTKNCGF